MSYRFPSERGQLPAAQQAVYDLIAARRGAVPPPYLPLLASPETADALEKFSATLWSGRLGKDVQEAIYLVTARAYRCDYQWHSHESKALAAGVPQAAVDSLRSGELPTEAQAGLKLAAAIRFAGSVHTLHAVPDEVFDKVTACLDEAEVSELAGFCALAAAIATLLNVRQTCSTSSRAARRIDLRRLHESS